MSKNNGKSTFAYFLRIAGVLTLICSVVALMLAVVNMVTKDTIEENTTKEKIEAVSRIFGEISGTKVDESGEHEVILVYSNEKYTGYVVTVKPQGYGGEIEMLVGINRDHTVKGVEIINMSETPGVGSRVKSDPNFLPQFTGKSGELTVGENVDGISGASISSRAVTAGINEALSVVVNVDETEVTEKESVETESVTAGTTATPEVESESGEPESYIDPSSVGEGDGANYYFPGDNKDVADNDATYDMEHDTNGTDAESDSDAPETT